MSNYDERSQNEIVQDILADLSSFLCLFKLDNEQAARASIITEEDEQLEGYLTSEYSTPLLSIYNLYEELLTASKREEDDFDIEFETDFETEE